MDRMTYEIPPNRLTGASSSVLIFGFSASYASSRTCIIRIRPNYTRRPLRISLPLRSRSKEEEREK
jgi:hypothetical protein